MVDPGPVIVVGEIIRAAGGTPIPNAEIRCAAAEAVAAARLALAAPAPAPS